MSPNAMRVLRGIGLEPRIRATALRPHSWTNRDWDSGRLTNERCLGGAAARLLTRPGKLFRMVAR
jgi:salicylate hydroxylase/6-hydroxynicotinate 3-monooxygenase